MRKYLTVFTVSWQNEFIYRLNFVLWRLRNILRLLMTYFLWRGIYVTNQNVFGYSREQMLTYVFLVLVVQSFVLSSPSDDNIGGEIANGDLTNYLVKPVGYLKYWLTRDLASKLLNLIFSFLEIFILYLVLHPSLQPLSSVLTIPVFLTIIILSMLLYFLFSSVTRLVTFWTPESTWGLAFITIILIEILAGGIFPLDILPRWISVALQFTPFPYLIYYPVAIFLGKITGLTMLRILLQTAVWVVILNYLTGKVWRAGLKVYGAEGR